MRVRTYEEMFLDVDREGQFIPGVAPLKEDSKTFRQIFEASITQGLKELTKVSYHSYEQSILGITKDIVQGRDSQLEQHFFDRLCGIVWHSVSLVMYHLSAKTLPTDGRVCYVGEFPRFYYENAAYTKTDEAGRRYSSAMDVFYMLALEVSEKNVWSTDSGYIKKQISEKQESLKADKPGLLAGKKKREHYEQQKLRMEQEIQDLKKEYISHGFGIDSDLFELRLIRLWVLHEGRADKKEDRKIRKKLLDWLDLHEKRLLNAVDRITAVERELGIENNGFRPIETEKPKESAWTDDDENV